MKSRAWALSALLVLAAGMAAAAGDEDARALLKEAASDLALGRNPAAVDKLERALKAQPGEPLAAEAQASLGAAYVASGRATDAEKALGAAVERARKASRPDIEAAALNDLGNLRAAQGRFADAQASYRQSAATATNAGRKPLAARANTNLARALADDGKRTEALAILPALTKDLGALPASRDKAYGLISAGRLYARLGDRSRGAAVLREGLEAADAANDVRARSAALGYLAEVYDQNGQRNEALALAQSASVAAA